MTRLRILADDLTGALDCAAAFGAGVTVHLGQPRGDGGAAIEACATGTRDVPLAQLPGLLAPALPWLRGADLAFKKVDSLLRGNTFAEIDWLARTGGFGGIVMAPAFPAQARRTRDGQQWWQPPEAGAAPRAVAIEAPLAALGWTVVRGQELPPPGERLAWLPDAEDDAALDAIATQARARGGWLCCGSAGLAHALRRVGGFAAADDAGGAVDPALLLLSASHHAVSRQQWQLLHASRWAARCLDGANPAVLTADALAAGGTPYPRLIELSPPHALSPAQAEALLHAQAQAIARAAPRPGVLAVVGGDTLLALCEALGAAGLRSGVPLARTGWGCARLVGGRWDGVVCHTRSGAFGGPEDLLEVVETLAVAR